jgi:hypothetical protein
MYTSGHGHLLQAPVPFAAVILCTAERGKSDEKTRSKWSRVLRYPAEYKKLDEPLDDFIKRKGGLNKCAARYARRLGRNGDYRRKDAITLRWPHRAERLRGA